jgi:phage baseplate assembly protein W
MATTLVTENPIYTDFDLSMVPNDYTNDVMPLVNTQAVKRSIRHLFMLNKYDIPFNLTGNNMLKSMLFEPVLGVTAGNIQSQAEWLIKNYEPRVQLKKVEVNVTPDERGYEITVYFRVISLNLEDRIDIFLQRAR